MTVTIENETGKTFDFDADSLINRVVEAALDAEDCPYEAEVSVLLTDDPSIREINRENRSIDRSTDVLSFPMITYDLPGDFSRVEEDPDNFSPETGELLLGDIVISLDKVREQAVRYGHSEKRELAFLVSHSMFHLMGYDHPEHGSSKEESDAKCEMEIKQEAVLQSLGITREF